MKRKRKELKPLTGAEQFVAETFLQAQQDLQKALKAGNLKKAAVICECLRSSRIIAQVVSPETIELMIEKEYNAMLTEEAKAKVRECAEQNPTAKPGELAELLKEQGLDVTRQAVVGVLKPPRRGTGKKKAKKPVEKKETKPAETKTEKVNHLNYYQSDGLEVIDIITSFGLDFCLGNAVKYILRAGRKNPETFREDLQKAVWYLNRVIETKENEQ